MSCSCLLGSSGQGISDVSDTQTTTTSENLPSTDSDSDSELSATGYVPETLYQHEQPPRKAAKAVTRMNGNFGSLCF